MPLRVPIKCPLEGPLRKEKILASRRSFPSSMACSVGRFASIRRLLFSRVSVEFGHSKRASNEALSHFAEICAIYWQVTRRL